MNKRPDRTVGYSTMAYNSLPVTYDAFYAFDTCHGDILANKVMRDLFRKHRVESKLGLVLLHKHCTLKHGERMTEANGTRGPSSVKGNEPCVWKINLADGRLIPLEFSVDAREIDWRDIRMQAFVQELLSVLIEFEAWKLLGLALYPGKGYHGRIEAACGRSAVSLTPDELNSLPHGTIRESAWFYTNDYLDRGCKCYWFSVGDE